MLVKHINKGRYDSAARAAREPISVWLLLFAEIAA